MILHAFLDKLHSIYPLSEGLRNELEENTKIVSLAKHDHILREGQCAKQVTAVLCGMLRSYYIHEGEDITSRFTQAGEVVLSVNSFYSQKTGYEFIEAMEKTEIAQISFEQQQHLLHKYLEYNFIVRYFTERYYASSEEHLFRLRKQSAEQKWHFFQNTYPHLIEQIPLKHIASFLGMRLETLSRVRSKY
ncbi:MAG: Crp/Fnr family transcriptional regulator [Chitinophagaceae bacterium]